MTNMNISKRSDTEPTELSAAQIIRKMDKRSQLKKYLPANLVLYSQVPNAFEDLIDAKRIVREIKLLSMCESPLFTLSRTLRP